MKKVIKEWLFKDMSVVPGSSIIVLGGCTSLGPGEDCLSSERCPYCTDPPKRFSWMEDDDD